MLITDEVLGSCLHTGGLVTLDGLVHADTGEVGVGGETLPVAASTNDSSEAAAYGSESYIGAFALEFSSKMVFRLVD